jgi:electron transfer flavoprotein beta subunit
MDSVVLVKQVPDTKAVTADAMKDDGTVNRAALPAIFNPDDLNALELALRVKDRHGGTVTVMTMGPPRASEVLREALFRGADRAVLLADKRFAASDTLATSLTLAAAVRKLERYDLVVCGRQAIDGDTAQVGPQTAEKLSIPQVTYVDNVIWMQNGHMKARRALDPGYEIVESRLPCLVTVMGDCNYPRPPSAKRMMRFKKARSPAELKREEPEAWEAARADLEGRGLLIDEWDADYIGLRPGECGQSGSPTLVKKVESVILRGGELQYIPPTDKGLSSLIEKLIEEHTLD